MDTLDSQVLDATRRWAAEGCRFVLVSVVRTWGSAPRQPGAWMAIDQRGRVHGSVSGGCVEEDLIARIRSGEFSDGRTQLIRYGVTRDEALRFGLPCGGTLELLIEAAPDVDLLEAMSKRIANGERLQRRVDLLSGEVSLQPADGRSRTTWDGRVFSTPHGPALRLLLVGAGQIARFLVPMAQALGYRVTVCDPREEYTSEWDVPGCELLRAMPDDVIIERGLDAGSAVVTLTHDPKLDDMALIEALRSPAFFVGALGSRKTNATRRARLRDYCELSQQQVDRLHGPVGLPIGSHTPPEIAVSIIAEITAVKNSVSDGIAQSSAGAEDAVRYRLAT
ncbi:XdhC family protein [Thiosocius teredinicola]|uniref:XdhC family protein n=1 Tax=Thiosocius teredinicola TaxID=1973002 RepID=UPI0009913797